MQNGDVENGGFERTLELLLKLKIQELKGDRNQSEMILFLDSLGFQSGEIIRLLGVRGNGEADPFPRPKEKAVQLSSGGSQWQNLRNGSSISNNRSSAA